MEDEDPATESGIATQTIQSFDIERCILPPWYDLLLVTKVHSLSDDILPVLGKD